MRNEQDRAFLADEDAPPPSAGHREAGGQKYPCKKNLIVIRFKCIHPPEYPIGFQRNIGEAAWSPIVTIRLSHKRADVLREKPNITRNKNGGKDVDSVSWYHPGPEYGWKTGDRINDHHLNLEKKQKG